MEFTLECNEGFRVKGKLREESLTLILSPLKMGRGKGEGRGFSSVLTGLMNLEVTER